ncbi:MAG TPA: GNAT family N-acetyltransferase [Cyclobacteriaceae bacterium]|nr:GNAT family N-acetyltransferase [Cyclobacteriaceae bacterium]
MQIKFEESASKGSFFVEENGQRLAEMTFSKAGDTTLIIDHTEVSDVLRGKNVGKQLVAFAVDYARKNNLKIIPLCPFTKSVIDKTPEYQDVLKK